jgi:ATP-dependent DNA ligase
MASDKRNFSNFSKFPGSIQLKGEYKGMYVFPSVTSIDSAKRTRRWTIFVRLIKTSNMTGKKPPKLSINWDVNNFKTVPASVKFYTNAQLPQGIIAQMWTEQGIVNSSAKINPSSKQYKITRSIPTYILKGKNLGRANATNVFTQALIQARSKYLLKVDSSAVRDKNSVSRFYPMAVHKYETVPRDQCKRIIFPAAVQRKLDGGRVVAYRDKGNVILYSRKLKLITGHKHVIKELNSIFDKINDAHSDSVYLDGEFYKHGMSLQEISGLMRREEGSKTTAKEKKNNMDVTLLNYHIFDIFFPKSTTLKDMSYLNRMVLLEKVFKNLQLTFVKKVQTVIVESVPEYERFHRQFLEEKYEGSIIRNLHSPYEFGINKEIRSYQVRKRKPRYTAEYEIIGFTEGSQGKYRGAIKWILETEDGTPFDITPVDKSYDELYELYEKLSNDPSIFENEYKGKMMTVIYDDISKDGVPLRAKAVGIRYLD